MLVFTADAETTAEEVAAAEAAEDVATDETAAEEVATAETAEEEAFDAAADDVAPATEETLPDEAADWPYEADTADVYEGGAP